MTTFIFGLLADPGQAFLNLLSTYRTALPSEILENVSSSLILYRIMPKTHTTLRYTRLYFNYKVKVVENRG